MRVAIATVQVPFITGGAEIHARMLQENLVKRGHEAEIVTIPFKWYPEKTLLDGLRMAALVDLTEVNGETIDQVIALKFPMYALRHPRKTVWLLHQHRQAPRQQRIDMRFELLLSVRDESLQPAPDFLPP